MYSWNGKVMKTYRYQNLDTYKDSVRKEMMRIRLINIQYQKKK